jgi:hypothetical protein
MKRNALLIVMVSIFVLFLTVPGYTWQGRMAGMGDASGLIEDESDYLVHPAGIAAGQGFNAYGNYRLTYDKAKKWDYMLDVPAGPFLFPYNASGHEWKNESQLGAAFSLGAGRMGVFFEYTGISGKYAGTENVDWGGSNIENNTFNLKNDLDNYALRIIYGLPAGSVKLGGELQIAYRSEKKVNRLIYYDGNEDTNYPWGNEGDPDNYLYPYMIPYDSKYWEAQGKVSVEGSMGASKYALTIKGGAPFSSKNNYQYSNNDNSSDHFNIEGDVKGWNAGGDFWLRVPVSSNMVLPFVVSAGYKKVQRDGAGMGEWDEYINYEHETKDIFVKVGGGMDYTPAKGTKIAAGIYYDYLNTKQNIFFGPYVWSGNTYHDRYLAIPDQSEHRITLKALAEKELCPKFVLRGGFNVFYGWVKSEYASDEYYNDQQDEIFAMSGSGSNMGVNASIGATVKIADISLEPFINCGYIKYETRGNGTLGSYPAAAELEKTNWLLGGGLSVRF